MKKLTFTIDINAPKEKVWYALWDEENYESWTSVFCPGSFIVSDWNEGSKIHFLSPEGGGMFSKITIKKPFERMLFQHIGEIQNFEEQPITEATKLWSGCEERYDLVEKNGITTVTASVDTVEDHVDYFEKTFPSGLERLKQIAEGNVKTAITVKTSVKDTLENVWNKFTQPEHVVNWNFASDDWHCPKAENQLEAGKNFTYTMASKDGEMSFDFVGTYDEVNPMKQFIYHIADGRKVTVKFHKLDNSIIVTENFFPEDIHSLELQRDGWQAILNNFKKYAEQ